MAPVRISNTVEQTSPSGIAAAIARLITSGDLAPGERLPTVRGLAAELGVSPATVSHAWQALSAVGLISSRGRSGTFVRPSGSSWLPEHSLGLAGHLATTRLDLSRGTPDPALLPRIGRALGRVAERAETASYHDEPVIPELAEVLRQAWPYDSPALTVVNGAMDAFSRALDVIVRFGDKVIVEEPGFPPFLDLLEMVGATVVPVQLDSRGVRPDSLATALKQSPVAMLIQPRAQNPTGVSMDADRAEELAQVIRTSRHGSSVIVLEDDHSGSITTAADVSLGRWLPSQVMHVRSFSKSHGPDLRIAALGGPTELLNRLIARRMVGPGWTSRMLQHILHELLTDPVSVAEVELARRTYRERQERLADALSQHGHPALPGDGVNTWIRVADERIALVQLAASGIRVAGGAPFFTAPHEDAQFLRVTVGHIRDEAEEVGAALAAVAVPLPASAVPPAAAAVPPPAAAPASDSG